MKNMTAGKARETSLAEYVDMRRLRTFAFNI
jgi:hypothetical protein